ncbi:MAG: eukaryotic translation initiation factor 3 subunit D [Muribaculaceae bacterium]|nr:eukaryotic translation initiation factor 3 subunit D [Muribaculaceae bacterium]
MTVNTNQILSVTEINQNFSKATKMVERSGSVVIFKNNKPRYMLVDIENNPLRDLTDDEKIDIVARRILKKYRRAFEVLAQC